MIKQSLKQKLLLMKLLLDVYKDWEKFQFL
nr:MAG TPA: hypothetical protein [Caudoviricetes sp.]